MHRCHKLTMARIHVRHLLLAVLGAGFEAAASSSSANTSSANTVRGAAHRLAIELNAEGIENNKKKGGGGSSWGYCPDNPSWPCLEASVDCECGAQWGGGDDDDDARRATRRRLGLFSKPRATDDRWSKGGDCGECVQLHDMLCARALDVFMRCVHEMCSCVVACMFSLGQGCIMANRARRDFLRERSK